MVSVHHAAFNALERHLKKYLTTDVAIERKWPTGDLPPKMVSIIYAGPRNDIALDPRILSTTPTTGNKINVTYQIRACEQPVQLDVWARRDKDRDEIVAQLDSILNTGLGFGVENGVIVELKDDWTDTFADFFFDSPLTLDTTNSMMQSEYRTTYSGTAYFMLTVTRETAKQTLINFKLSLDDGETYDTTTIE